MNTPLKKSILIVLYYYHPYVSGLSNYAKELAEGLSREGHSVTVLTTRYDAMLPRSSCINGVNVVRVPVIAHMGKGVIAPTFWLNIIRLSRGNDIINFHLPMIDAGLACLFIKTKKLVTTYHCDLNLGKGMLNNILETISYRLMDLVLNKSRVVVVNSLDYFHHSRMKKYSQKAVEIYPPIRSIRHAQKQNLDYQNLLTKFSINPKSYKIGFVGRLVYEKGLKFLFDAIPYLEDQIGDFVIIVAGEDKNIAGGTIKDDLSKYLKLYPTKIVFTGFLQDRELVQFYSMIDVLVLPSIDPLESFGMVQVEAMLCGTPVIASDLPGVRTVVLETGFGALVEPRNSVDIAVKIATIRKKDFTFDIAKLQKFGSSCSLERYNKTFH